MYYVFDENSQFDDLSKMIMCSLYERLEDFTTGTTFFCGEDARHT